MTSPLQITNLQPIDYTQVQFQPIDLNDPVEQAITDSIQPLLDQFNQPLQPGQPVTITLNQQPYQSYSNDLISGLVDSDLNSQRDDQLSVLLYQAGRHRGQTPQPWRQSQAMAELVKHHCPLPSSTIKYTYNVDLQNQAKDHLRQPTTDTLATLRLGLLGNLASDALSDRTTFVLTNKTNYQAFLKHVAITLGPNVTPALHTNWNDTTKVPYGDDIFTSWLTADNLEPNSFNRYLVRALQTFAPKDPLQWSWLPLNWQAQLNPVAIAFIDINQLANGTQLKYQTELSELSQAVNQLRRFKIKSIHHIRSAKQIQTQTQRSHDKDFQKDNTNTHRHAVNRGLKRTLPSVKWQIKQIKRILHHHIVKTVSDNTFRQTQRTFMRPSRRHPDDVNIAGHLTKIKYRPDLAIYLDTSGSISEAQYKSAITELITIAKQLNTNLYFVSFSHYVAQPVKLKTKGCSVKQIYKQIQRIPKAGGGTEYEHVWHLIDVIDQQNQQQHRAPQLNFIITDFAYDLSSSFVPALNRASTKQTYYLPLAVTQDQYRTIRQYAIELADQLLDKGDTTIYQRLIM